jgi:glycosyltransferase involved in cell wall biosynthesis
MTPRLLSISACVIACDEEHDIGDAISSLDFVDELILVLDTRSSDRTEDVARASIADGQTLKIVKQDWLGHVAQKNVALDHASRDWVLCLDADERVSEQLRDEILELFVSGPPSVAGFSCPRRTHTLGRWIRHGGWYPDRKVRLFRKDAGRWSGVDPHDRVDLRGVCRELRGDLQHYSYRHLFDHIDKMDSYTEISATRLFQRGRRLALVRMLVQPPGRFAYMYFLRLGFLDGYAGLILAGLASYYVFLKYAKLFEKQRAAMKARSHGAVKYLPGQPRSGRSRADVRESPTEP